MKAERRFQKSQCAVRVRMGRCPIILEDKDLSSSTASSLDSFKAKTLRCQEIKTGGGTASDRTV